MAENIFKEKNARKYDGQPETEIPIAVLICNDKQLKEKTDKILSRGKSSEVSKFLNDLGVNMLEPEWKEPIFGRLTKISKTQIVILVFATVIFSLLPAISAAIEGVLVNPKIELDMFHDYQYFILFSVGLPILLILPACYFGVLPTVIVELCLSNVVSISKRELNKFVENARQTFGHKFVTYPPYIIGGIVTLVAVFAIVLGPTDSWHSPNMQPFGTVSGWLSMLLIFPFYYLIAVIVFRLGAAYVVLSRLFLFPTNVQPLHPDGSGGLHPLGRLSMRLNLAVFYFGIVSVFGIMINVDRYNQPLLGPINVLIMLSYVTGAIVVFFLPLYSTHNRMVEAKKKTLKVINERYELINGKLHNCMIQGEDINLKFAEEIEVLREMYSTARSMPVYPFNVKIISSFVTSFLGPVLLSRVPQYLPLVWDWLRN